MLLTSKLGDSIKISLTTLFARETPLIGKGKGPINSIFLWILFFMQ